MIAINLIRLPPGWSFLAIDYTLTSERPEREGGRSCADHLIHLPLCVPRALIKLPIMRSARAFLIVALALMLAALPFLDDQKGDDLHGALAADIRDRGFGSIASRLTPPGMTTLCKCYLISGSRSANARTPIFRMLLRLASG